MKAPVIALPYINEQGVYHSEESLGKIVILTFWVSWCPDCGIDLPKKEQLYQSINGDQVEMVTINVTGRERDSKAGIRYTERYLQQPTLADKERMVYDQFECSGVPTTVIINRDGTLYKQFGDKADFLDIVGNLGELLKK